MTDWKLRDKEFKGILARHDNADDELGSVEGAKAELLPHLRTHEAWSSLPSGVIQDVAMAKTFTSFNRAIDKIYDYADENKIWLGFLPLEKP